LVIFLVGDRLSNQMNAVDVEAEFRAQHTASAACYH
jgi:hypothetical protein